MPEMSDKELDKLFQEAASGLEPAYDPQDWEMLRARLDGDDKAAFVRRVTLRILVGAMLLSSVWSTWQGDTKTSFQEAAVVETTTLLSADTDTALARTVPAHREDAGAQAQDLSETTMEGLPNTAADTREGTVRSSATDTTPEETAAQALTANTTARSRVAADHTTTTPNATGPDRVSPGDKNKAEEAGLEVTNQHRRVQRQTAVATSEENNTIDHTDRTGQVNAKQGKSATSVSNQRDSLSAVRRVAGRPVDAAVNKGTVDSEQSKITTGTTRIADAKDHAVGGVKEEDNDGAHREAAGREVSKEGQATAPVKDQENEQKPAANAVTNNNKLVVGVQADEKDKGLYPETQETVRYRQNETDTAQALNRDRQAGEAEVDVYVREKDNVIGVNGPPMRKRNKGETISGKESLVAAVQQDSTHVKEGEKKDTAPVAEVQEEVAKQDEVKLSRWYIKLPVSPDFSTVGYTRPGKPGINLGLLVEFMPVTRIGISTGAIWSRKIYTSKNPEKTYGSGPYQVKADWLDGECRVLDLPLNVTYYIRPAARTNFSITAGVSSYIMLSEDYTYGVKGPAKDYIYNERFTRKNNDWASMLNLSIGIQHRLSRRFLVQAEPFLKAPLSGVGEGKVDLVSSGVFFSLKYQL
ncbi:PorT family protein [Dawidia soli]|uniref:Outer membrane protein beta-barrel domain-containing protein n=1 Tax=Dawidia soli TaxID=2782352 RepID=A0AAP2D5W6_9BACT|nr:PorT family protein [Dawidia soli]MBT1685908.1 hypothetical protein [Dawidia soli]